MSRKILPSYLVDLQKKIEERARAAGLDFFQIIYELLSYDEMDEIAAYGGFPLRYPHYRFGVEYNKLRKSSTYGLHKIYELVINNDPCYAYLMEGNSIVEQKMVMAHVTAHCDFFKNNLFFKDTNKNMINTMANHRSKVISIMDRVGIDRAEEFIDACLSIENLIDSALGPQDLSKMKRVGEKDEGLKEKEDEITVGKEYLESFIKREEGGDNLHEEQSKELVPEIPSCLPARDVMGFLLLYAPLKDWEQTILDIIRQEAYYFAPQAMTKIMNEGWATYWHSKLMTEAGLIDCSEVIDYADRASAIVSSSGRMLNPYKLGVELFRDIEDRWNKGRFGRSWEECTDVERKKNWDTGAGLGMKKIFEVRKIYNDVTFIDEFLTEDFCRRKKLFVFGYNYPKKRYEILSREFKEIKSALLASLTNLGNPIIEVVDSNYANSGQLMLEHKHEGVELRMDWAEETLKAIYRIWKRPVLISTVVEGKPVVLKFDGKEHARIPK